MLCGGLRLLPEHTSTRPRLGPRWVQASRTGALPNQRDVRRDRLQAKTFVGTPPSCLRTRLVLCMAGVLELDLLLKNIAQSSENNYTQRSNDDVWRFRNECLPMVIHIQRPNDDAFLNECSSIVIPFVQVRKTGLATCHVKVLIQAWIMNKNKFRLSP